jgi:hypothetical protein
MAAFGSKIEGGGVGKTACIDRSTARSLKVDHLEMAGPRSVAKRPGAKPVTRVERRAAIKQFGRQRDAIPIHS